MKSNSYVLTTPDSSSTMATLPLIDIVIIHSGQEHDEPTTLRVVAVYSAFYPDLSVEVFYQGSDDVTT